MIETILYKLLVLRPWQKPHTQTLLTKKTTIPNIPQHSRKNPAELHLQNTQKPHKYICQEITNIITLENHPLIIILETDYIGNDWERPSQSHYCLLNFDPDIPHANGLGPLHHWTQHYLEYGLQPTLPTDLTEHIRQTTRAFLPTYHDTK